VVPQRRFPQFLSVTSRRAKYKMGGKTLSNLVHEALKDVYYLEKRLSGTLAKMAEGASSQDLSLLFERRREDAEVQIARLETIFSILGKQPEGPAWTAVDGIVEEAHAMLVHYQSSPALDVGLVSAAETIAQYGLTRYRCLKRWAGVLRLAEATRLLNAILRDQLRMNAQLGVLAECLLEDAGGVPEAPDAKPTRRAPHLSEAACRLI
jgi:ferritin-like metal-binding protein YciE